MDIKNLLKNDITHRACKFFTHLTSGQQDLSLDAQTYYTIHPEELRDEIAKHINLGNAWCDYYFKPENHDSVELSGETDSATTE